MSLSDEAYVKARLTFVRRCARDSRESSYRGSPSITGLSSCPQSCDARARRGDLELPHHGIVPTVARLHHANGATRALFTAERDRDHVVGHVAEALLARGRAPIRGDSRLEGEQARHVVHGEDLDQRIEIIV